MVPNHHKFLPFYVMKENEIKQNNRKKTCNENGCAARNDSKQQPVLF